MNTLNQRNLLYPSGFICWMLKRTGFLVLAILLSLGTQVTMAQDPGTPSGNGVMPKFVSGNPSCASEYGSYGLKVESDFNRTVTFTNQAGVILIGGPDDAKSSVMMKTDDGVYFDWSLTDGSCVRIIGVIVKGGPNANLYNYYPVYDLTSDSDLHAPINPDNLKPYGISHIEFCYEPDCDIQCAVDDLVQCDESTHPENTGYPSLGLPDGCSSGYTCTYGTPKWTDKRIDGDCDVDGYLYKIERTWTIDDIYTCTQIITVVDTEAPTLAGCPSDVTVECYEVPAPAKVTASDKCDDDVPVVYTQTRTDGNCPDSYTLTREWTATDDCGNSASCTQIITVVDTEAPTLTGCPSDVTVECYEVPAPAMVAASDKCDDDVPVVYTQTRTDGNCPDSYTLTREWTATDDCGNSASCTQIITVVDTEAPTLTGCPSDMTVECYEVPSPAMVTAIDKCDDDVPVVLVETSNLDACGNGTITRTWTATDDCGNSASCSQTITINDCGDFELYKTTDGVVDKTKDWQFTLKVNGQVISEDNTLNDENGILFEDLGHLSVSAGTYTVCESNVPAGWTSTWKVDGQIVFTYTNNSGDIIGDNSTICFDFTLPKGVPPDCAFVIEVDNSFPGGDPRTPGYWKNWNSCSGGNQFTTAEAKGGLAEGFATLDDFVLEDGSFVVGCLTIDNCDQAVALLDARTTDNKGKKMANDAAYTLMRAALAAKLNRAVGAEWCQQAQDALDDAEALLCAVVFDGTSGYLRPKDAEYSYALCIAHTLDLYNNGELCPSGGYSCTMGDAQPVTNAFDAVINEVEQTFSDGIDMTIFPNPAYHEFYLDVKGLESQDVFVQIYDQFGRIVREEKVSYNENDRIRMTIPDVLSDGIYYVRLKHQSDIKMKPIVITKDAYRNR